jgi:hypothetical protein
MPEKKTKKTTKKETVITGYKGFDKDFKCRDFQFEVGKTYKHDGPVKACESGFHACEMPLDVLGYYPPESRFAIVSQCGETHKMGDDTKIASAKITIGAEIKLPEIIKRAVDWILEKAKSNLSTGNYAHAASTGDRAHAASTGDRAHAASTGYGAHAASTGYRAHAASTGNYAHAASTGDGGCAFAGFNGEAKAGKNGAIAICFYCNKEKRSKIVSGNIGENGLIANTFYKLNENGNFVEA